MSSPHRNSQSVVRLNKTINVVLCDRGQGQLLTIGPNLSKLIDCPPTSSVVISESPDDSWPGAGRARGACASEEDIVVGQKAELTASLYTDDVCACLFHHVLEESFDDIIIEN